jgi:DNA-binding HxlR family transcriptional regulator
MGRKSAINVQCPVARSMERVGEWWSILILHQALLGATRFEQFTTHLGISSNMLTRRLNTLVAAGLLKRRQYQARPPRYDYLVTELGEDFRGIVVTMLSWGISTWLRRGKALCLSIARRDNRRI